MASDTIYVCPLDAVSNVVAEAAPSHLVTLINADMVIDTPQPIARQNHLRLIMHDVNGPRDGYTPPDSGHITQLLNFGEGWKSEARGRSSAPLLIHCWAGISRSTAAAYILLCALNPDEDEQHIAGLLRAASDTATPNPLMIKIADGLLGRNGRMSAAISEIGRGAFASEGRVFTLPARLNAAGASA